MKLYHEWMILNHLERYRHFFLFRVFGALITVVSGLAFYFVWLKYSWRLNYFLIIHSQEFLYQKTWFVSLIFLPVCLVIHEFGHALAGYLTKTEVSGIVVHTFGPFIVDGETRMVVPKGRVKQYIVDTAGIRCNFLLAAIFIVMAMKTEACLLFALSYYNLILAFVNLLPIPILETDGYWIILNILNLPSLMSAFAYRKNCRYGKKYAHFQFFKLLLFVLYAAIVAYIGLRMISVYFY